MKLTDALTAVTKISTNKKLNLENYMRSVQYISNLYKFHYIIKDLVDIDKVQYLPTFKDCYISEKLGLATITEENELRLFTLKSPLFLVDKTVEDIIENLDKICSQITHENDTITFYLK